MKKILALLLVGVGMGLCVLPADAQIVTYYSPVVTATVPVVSSSNYGYGPTATVVNYPATTAYYAPAVTTSSCCGAPAATTAYYAPSVPVTTYYAPAAPVTTYYAPAVATTAYYAPTVSYYAPTVSYYAPTVAYYAPTVSYYAPAASYYAPVTYYRGYVPGQPIRNFFRGGYVAY